MGCFLACFGFKNKKKHRKPRNRYSSAEQSYGSYVPLDSDVSLRIVAPENLISSEFQTKEKPKESSSLKVKKKVSFNLNVKAYEPIQNEDEICSYLSEGEEKTKWELSTETISMSIRAFPENYRYKNCRDSYDSEDQELKWDEHELINSNEIEEEDDDDEEEIRCRGEYSWKSNPVFDQNIEERDRKQILDHLKNKSNCHGRNRSGYVSSVLNSVENFTQCKEIKAKPLQFKRQKENITSEQQEQESSKHSDSSAFRNMRNPNEVDACLSNWLNSKETPKITKRGSITADQSMLYNINETGIKIPVHKYIR